MSCTSCEKIIETFSTSCEQVMNKFLTRVLHVLLELLVIGVLLDLPELKTTSMGGWVDGWVVGGL